MMLFNDFVAWDFAKARQSELLKETEIARLLKQARAGTPRLLNWRLALQMLGAALTGLLITQMILA